jgi:hypothetical protein
MSLAFVTSVARGLVGQEPPGGVGLRDIDLLTATVPSLDGTDPKMVAAMNVADIDSQAWRLRMLFLKAMIDNRVGRVDMYTLAREIYSDLRECDQSIPFVNIAVYARAGIDQEWIRSVTSESSRSRVDAAGVLSFCIGTLICAEQDKHLLKYERYLEAKSALMSQEERDQYRVDFELPPQWFVGMQARVASTEALLLDLYNHSEAVQEVASEEDLEEGVRKVIDRVVALSLENKQED